MRLRRRDDEPATYAAIVAGRYLWVALPREAPVFLTQSGRSVDLPTQHDDTQPGHHGVRLDLDGLPIPGGAEVRYRVRTGRGRGRPCAGPVVRPAPAGTPYAVLRDEAGHLHVVRRPTSPAVTVRALRLVGETVQLDLDPDQVAATSQLRLLDAADQVTAVIPIAGATATITPRELIPVASGDPTLRAFVDAVPVRRRVSDLADPGSAALLPAVHPVGAEHPVARLRWAPDGSLVLRRLTGQPG